MSNNTDHDSIVQMKDISKRFGSVQALWRVNLELRRGEVLGLVGDNAAGKSTLVKILAGAVRADEGEIFIEGHPVTIPNPGAARAFGIEMIYQDLALFNNLDVAANVFTGREHTRRICGVTFLDKRKMYREAEEFLSNLNIDIRSAKLLVEKMSGGQRQMVAVTRATSFKSKILIMDEPTAALGVKEASTLLQLITRLRDQGLSIILITHRLPDVLAVGNRVMVLKKGERQGVLAVRDCTMEDIETLIVRGHADHTAASA